MFVWQSGSCELCSNGFIEENKMKTAKDRDAQGASWNYAEIWDKFPVPARPCKKELALIEQKINAFKGNPKVLILGSTIEYRSLCKRLGIAPVVADFVKSNYDRLTEYSTESFAGEEFFEIDWLDIQEKDRFDFILGHRVFNVIGKQDIQRMFKVMFNALKPEGIFFCRGNIFDSSFRDKLEEFVETWSRAPREYPLFTYIEVALYMNCCDTENYIDYPACRQRVERWFREGKISPSDFEEIRLLVSLSNDARFRTAEKHEITRGYSTAGFESAEWVTTGEEFSRQMPIIILRK